MRRHFDYRRKMAGRHVWNVILSIVAGKSPLFRDSSAFPVRFGSPANLRIERDRGETAGRGGRIFLCRFISLRGQRQWRNRNGPRKRRASRFRALLGVSSDRRLFPRPRGNAFAVGFSTCREARNIPGETSACRDRLREKEPFPVKLCKLLGKLHADLLACAVLLFVN